MPVGLVSHNVLINTQNMKPTSPNKQSVLVPVRLGNNSSAITFDYKDKQDTLGYSPKYAHIINFVPVRLGNIDSDITFNRNINSPPWSIFLCKLSSFMPIRLGSINSDITLKYDINRPSWPTSPYKLPSFVLVKYKTQEEKEQRP